MPYDPFVILGVKKGATQSEILEAYKEKRAHYQSLVWEEGEVGANAARMIDDLDRAYQVAMEYSHDSASVSGDEQTEGFDVFSDVKEAIKNKDFARAQSLLDDNFDRGGEWHYYQAIVYYEKSWLQESKKQLEIALSIDPNNAKYQKALDNMKKKIDGTNAFKDQSQEKGRKRERTNRRDDDDEYRYRSYRQQSEEDTACRVCQGLLCADCCCECMGGDLISCC
jgi:molecular chaperone DnaJ